MTYGITNSHEKAFCINFRGTENKQEEVICDTLLVDSESVLPNTKQTQLISAFLNL